MISLDLKNLYLRLRPSSIIDHCIMMRITIQTRIMRPELVRSLEKKYFSTSKMRFLTRFLSRLAR